MKRSDNLKTNRGLSPALAALLLASVTLCFLAGVAGAGSVPGQINYQGKLTDNAGHLVNQKYDIAFSLFTSANIGETVWSEIHNEVNIVHGIYNVRLGSIEDLRPVFQGYPTLWLELAVNGETLTPRQQMVSAGYAMRTDGITVNGSGKVGIGTDEPAAALHVVGEVESIVGENSFYLAPEGTIVIWTGLLTEIPTGWQLCDGTAETPDLRDMFVYGVDSAEDPGGGGGVTSHSHTFFDTVSQTLSTATAHSHSYTGVPSHSHSVSPSASSVSSAGSHSHQAGPWSGTSSSAGAHSHSITNYKSYGSSNSAPGGYYLYSEFSGNTASGGAHTHSYNIANFTSGAGGGHGHSVTMDASTSGSSGVSSPTTGASGSHSHTLEDYTVSGTTSETSELPPHIRVAFIMRLPR